MKSSMPSIGNQRAAGIERQAVLVMNPIRQAGQQGRVGEFVTVLTDFEPCPGQSAGRQEPAQAHVGRGWPRVDFQDRGVLLLRVPDEIHTDESAQARNRLDGGPDLELGTTVGRGYATS